MAHCEHRCEKCEKNNSVDGAVKQFIAYEANRRQLAEFAGVDVADVQIRFAKQDDSLGEVMDRWESPGSVVAVMDRGQLVFHKRSELRVTRGVGDDG